MGRITVEAFTTEFKTKIHFIDREKEMSVEEWVKKAMEERRRSWAESVVLDAMMMLGQGRCIELWSWPWIERFMIEEPAMRTRWFKEIKRAEEAARKACACINGRRGFVVVPADRWSNDGARENGWTWTSPHTRLLEFREWGLLGMDKRSVLEANPRSMHLAAVPAGELKRFVVWDKRGIEKADQWIGTPTKAAKEVVREEAGETVDLSSLCQMIVAAERARKEEERESREY